MRIVNVLLTVLVVLCNSVILFSQTVIRGKVVDSNDYTPVANVNIVIDDTNIGCASDKKGRFALRVDNLPVDVTISHVYYKTIKLRVNEPRDLKLIRMSIHYHELPDVEVRPIIPISKGYLLDVYDYAFCGDTILLAGYSYKDNHKLNPWIYRITPDGDLIDKKSIGEYGEFHCDCNDLLQYMTDEYAFQVDNMKDSVCLSSPQWIKSYSSIQKNCICNTGTYHILRYDHFLNKVVNYHKIDSHTKEDQLVISIFDYEKIRILKEMGSANINGLKKALNKPSPKVSMILKMYCDTIYAPLFFLNDSLYLFNSIDDEVIVYDNMVVEQRRFPKRIKDLDFFQDEIVLDKVRGRLYAVFMEKGEYFLKEVNLDNGEFGEMIRLPDFKYIEDVQVNNDVVYFLYRKQFSSEMQALYRMKIESAL